MKSNANKCHLLVSTNNTVNIRVENFYTKNSDCEKLLEVNFDHKLTFNIHISDSCKKASEKFHAITKVTSYMNISKRRIIINALLKSQFSYYSLVWMSYNCVDHNKINRLHERCLRKIYSDNTSFFEALLERGSSVFIHNRNLQLLDIKMYKASKGLSPPIIT